LKAKVKKNFKKQFIRIHFQRGLETSVRSLTWRKYRAC